LPVSAVFILIAAFINPTYAQSLPLEIPFAAEWAASAHARASAEAFNHWNDEGMVPIPCARCHTTPGFRDYIGADGSAPGVLDKPALTGSVIACIACHSKVTRALTKVTFPSGLEVKNLGPESRCMTCHQGRESTISVNKAVAGLEEDNVDKKLKFINIHYRVAAATRYGTQAKGAYEYPRKHYNGLYLHDKEASVCIDCHTLHTFSVDVANCDTCHRQAKKKKDFKNIRRTKGDFDGDMNEKEGIAHEINTLHEALYSAIQAYGKNVAGQPIVYEPHTYPYFFADTNRNGKPDGKEAIFPNQYKSWTPRLLKAAYNYQFVANDPGVYTHNPMYVIQILYDSLADLATKVPVKMSEMLRPQP